MMTCYAHLASMRFEHSVCHGSLKTYITMFRCFVIYLYTYIGIFGSYIVYPDIPYIPYYIYVGIFCACEYIILKKYIFWLQF